MRAHYQQEIAAPNDERAWAGITASSEGQTEQRRAAAEAAGEVACPVCGGTSNPTA